MATSFVGFAGSWADAKHLRRICARYAHIEAREGCADPATKRASDPDVSSSDDAMRAGIDKGELASMSSWNVCRAPRSIVLGPQVWDSKRHKALWPPKKVRLSDAGLLWALCALGKEDRYDRFPLDFDARGCVRPGPVPRGPGPIFLMNGN
jgi:hypothetical protein